LAGNQFAEHNAERVDIGGGRDWFAAALFGRSISGRERGQVRLQRIRIVEQFGDAEIQQLDLAIVRNEHVGRLQVAMHDQRAMRGFDRAADLQEQCHALSQVESAPARVFGQRLSLDQLERDVGDAAFGHAAFDEACDAGMAQLRQRLALPPKLLLRIRRIQAAPQQFQRNVLAHAFDLSTGAKYR